MQNRDYREALTETVYALHNAGIELFTAMRRLGKKVWMLNYNGEAHNLLQRKNRKDLDKELSELDRALRDIDRCTGRGYRTHIKATYSRSFDPEQIL